MRPFFAILVGAGLFATGCATKKYVQTTVAPVQAKVNQVGDQANKNSQAIEDTRTQLKDIDERAQKGIDAATERAATADQHATEAAKLANEADQLANADRQDIAQLRGVIENIDDYKLQASTNVHFDFDRYVLTKDDQQELDRVASEVKGDKRFFIALEGFTDEIGSKAYNDVLSRKRADQVAEYLVAQAQIPSYRIYMIGLGKNDPIVASGNRRTEADDRRVVIKVFCADQVIGPLTAVPDNSAADRASADQPNQ